MYTFVTETGSIYTIANGRIRRIAKHAIAAGRGDEPQMADEAWSFTMPAGPPVVGRRFTFRTKFRGGTTITTSPVREIHREAVAA